MKSACAIRAAERPTAGPLRATTRILGWEMKVRVMSMLLMAKPRRMVSRGVRLVLVFVGVLDFPTADTSAPLYV